MVVEAAAAETGKEATAVAATDPVVVATEAVATDPGEGAMAEEETGTKVAVVTAEMATAPVLTKVAGEEAEETLAPVMETATGADPCAEALADTTSVALGLTVSLRAKVATPLPVGDELGLGLLTACLI